MPEEARELLFFVFPFYSLFNDTLLSSVLVIFQEIFVSRSSICYAFPTRLRIAVADRYSIFSVF